MGDLAATIEGLAVAAEALGGLAGRGHPLPFVSGNVSLHNQSGERAVPASPIVWCTGVLHDVTTAVGIALRGAGHFLVLVGEPRDELTGSAFVRDVLAEPAGAPPSLDLAREARLHELAVLAAEGRWVAAAHDISDGGLGVTLAEMVMACPPERALGAQVDLAVLEASAEAALFSERSAVLFEIAPERAPRLLQAARDRSLLAWPVGTVVGGGVLRLRLPAGATLQWTADELRAASAAPLRRLWNEEVDE
jgi:phosphoribosylformylglycinamidine synthase